MPKCDLIEKKNNIINRLLEKLKKSESEVQELKDIKEKWIKFHELTNFQHVVEECGVCQALINVQVMFRIDKEKEKLQKENTELKEYIQKLVNQRYKHE